MPWKYTDEYYREYTRTTWNESAEAYVGLMRNLEPFRSDLIARLAPRPGERILDLGTGPGEPAITIAGEVGPSGHVTGVDLSENMVSIAQRVAEARGLGNVDFRAMDCGDLQFPDETYDAAVSSFGFQIFTDPEAAARGAYRVIRRGGRIAVSVWGTANRVPWIHAIIGPMLEHAEPDETGYIPTPYETGGPGEMTAFLEAAGFRDAKEERRRYALTFADEAAYFQAILKATPIGHSLSEEPEAVQKEVLQKARGNLRPWKTSDGLSIPGEAVVVIAHKPP
ncbi:MAG TPA: methyltransferase domain-containing protein [Thermoplasmata archaeon]|jgi:SAM-dependent methyltransferase|nr:methyltransferase domain-containing protein [Thermoplasmata archaeon]